MRMLVWPPPSQTLDCAPLPFLKHGLIMYLAFMFYHALGYLCIPIRKTFPYLLFVYLTVYLFIYLFMDEEEEREGKGKKKRGVENTCVRVCAWRVWGRARAANGRPTP